MVFTTISIIFHFFSSFPNFLYSCSSTILSKFSSTTSNHLFFDRYLFSWFPVHHCFDNVIFILCFTRLRHCKTHSINTIQLEYSINAPDYFKNYKKWYENRFWSELLSKHIMRVFRNNVRLVFNLIINSFFSWRSA